MPTVPRRHDLDEFDLSGANDTSAWDACYEAARADPYFDASLSPSGTTPMGYMYVPAGITARIWNWKPKAGGVEIRVDPAATLMPVSGASSSYQMIWLDKGTTQSAALKDIRIRAEVGSWQGGRKPSAPYFGFDVSKMFTVNVDKADTGASSEFQFLLPNNIEYFELDDVFFVQNQSRTASGPASATACITGSSNASSPKTWSGPGHAYTHPRHVWYNRLYCIESPYGYGLFQMDSGEDIHMTDTLCGGGKNVRLETDKPSAGYINNLFGTRVYGVNGGQVVVLSPHDQHNGSVVFDGVYGESMEYAVRVTDFANNGTGKFDNAEFSNVYHEPGTNAQVGTIGNNPWDFNGGQNSKLIVNKAAPAYNANIVFHGKVHGAPTSGFQSKVSDVPYDTDMSGFPKVTGGTPQPTIDTQPTDGTTSQTAAFTYHVPSGSWQFETKLNQDGALYSDWAADDTAAAGASGAKTYSSLPRGHDYTFLVRAYHPTTGVRGVKTSYTWSIAPLGGGTPDTPVYSSGPTEGSSDTDLTPTFGWGAAALATSYEYNIDGAAYVTVGASLTVTLAALDLGAHQLKVRSRNSVGVSTPAIRNWTIISSGNTGTIAQRTVGAYDVHGEWATTNTSQLRLAVPTMLVGDIVVATIRARGNTGVVFTPPPKFIAFPERRIATPDLSMVSYYHVVEDIESSPFYVFDLGVAVDAQGDLLVITGADLTQFVDDDSGATGHSATANPAAVIAAEDESLLILLEYADSVTGHATTTDMTEVLDMNDVFGNAQIYMKSGIPKGSTVDSSTLSATQNWAAIAFVISPKIEIPIGVGQTIAAAIRCKDLAEASAVYQDHFLGTVKEILGQGTVIICDLSAVQDVNGDYTVDTAKYDALAAKLAQYGLVWLPCLKFTNAGGLPVTPKLWNAAMTNHNAATGLMHGFRLFAISMYQRYGPSGTFTAVGWQPVARWQIWSDIDTDNGAANPNPLGSLLAPANYWEVCTRGAVGIRSAAGATTIEVIGPGSVGTNADLIASVVDWWKSQAKQSLFTMFDGWSVTFTPLTGPKSSSYVFQAASPYYSASADPNVYKNTDWLRRLMDQEGGIGKGIFVTGGGYAGSDVVNSYHDPGALLTGKRVLWVDYNSTNIGGDERAVNEGDQPGWVGGAIDRLGATPSWLVRMYAVSQLFDSQPPIAVAGDVAEFVKQSMGLVYYDEATDEPLPAGAIDQAQWKDVAFALQHRAVNAPNTPPTVEIVTPTPGQQFITAHVGDLQAVVNVQAICIDPDDDILTSVQVEGQEMVAGASHLYSKNVAVDAALPPGRAKTLHVRATDLHGATTAETVDIIAVVNTGNITRPVVDILHPLSTDVVNTPSRVLEARVRSESGVSSVTGDTGDGILHDMVLVVDETDIYAVNLPINYLSSLASLVTLTVRAKEASALALEGTASVVVSTGASAPGDPPFQRPDSPVTGQTVSASRTLRVEAQSAFNVASVTVALNGGAVEPMVFTDPFWTLQTTELVPGSNTAVFVTTDDAGDSTTQTITFTVEGDIETPPIIIIPPPEPVVEEWKLVTMNARTGEDIAEFNPKELRFGRYMSRSGYMNCGLPLDSIEGNIESKVKQRYMDYEIRLNEMPIIAGNIDTVIVDLDTRMLRIAGGDWQSYLEERFLDFKPTDQRNFFQIETDIFTVVERLLDFVLVDPARQVNFAYNNGTAGYVTTVHYLAADMASLNDIITGLADQHPGFDMITTVDKRILLFAPYRVGKTEYAVVQGRNIKSMHYENSGPQATEVWGTGAGSSTSKMFASRRDMQLELDVRRRTSVVDFGEVIRQSILDSLTEAEFERVTGDVVDAWISVYPQSGDNFWALMDLGLEFRTTVDLGLRQIDDYWRAVSLEGYTNDEGTVESVLTISSSRSAI